MVADGTWSVTNDKDAKISALTTQYEKSKKKFNELEKRIKKISDDGKGKTATGRTFEKDWHHKKVGETRTNPDTGAKVVWCAHHGDGMYMPHPHNHDEWKKRKESFKKGGKTKKHKAGGGNPKTGGWYIRRQAQL